MQVAWIRADTKAILTLNERVVTQNSRYALLTQVRAVATSLAVLGVCSLVKHAKTKLILQI